MQTKLDARYPRVGMVDAMKGLLDAKRSRQKRLRFGVASLSVRQAPDMHELAGRSLILDGCRVLGLHPAVAAWSVHPLSVP